MSVFDSAFVSKITKAEVKSSVASGFERIETDSRKDLTRSLFIALKGERFDGHEFLHQAVEKGATGLLIHEWRPEFEALTKKASVFLVKDTLIALQVLARGWREKCGFHVVGITGSNGKTTTKELAHQILKSRFKTSASPGSFNNHWGVPLSLLQAKPTDQVVLQEMGMNHKGEISDLCLIARPDVAVVTNVGTAHIGELGSIEAIQSAKNEIYLGSPKAIHIYNLDNEYTLSLYQNALKNGFPKERLITFSSFNPAADVHLRAGKVDGGSLHVTGKILGVSGSGGIKAFGRQTVINLMAAASIASALRMTPQEIFSQFQKIDLQTWGRNQWLTITPGPAIIFDGYNANPDSMKMLLRNLYELETKGNKAFIFGDMRELGDMGEKAHREIAEFAGQIGLAAIWYMGSYEAEVKDSLKKSGFSGELLTTQDHEDSTAKKFFELLGPEDVVALKASRGSRIERVLSSWGVDGF